MRTVEVRARLSTGVEHDGCSISVAREGEDRLHGRDLVGRDEEECCVHDGACNVGRGVSGFRLRLYNL